jgi:uroporphyrinogen III methyltransferase/synthase
VNGSGSPAGPLSGLAVVVTRDEPPGGPLAVRLAGAGARVLHWPAMAVAPPADPEPLARELAALESYDWLALTSAHAVAAVAGRRTALPPALRVAAVGAATAAAVRERGWRVDLVPEDFHVDALIASFAEAGEERSVAGRRILFPASDRAARTLQAGLAALGAEVVRVEAYRTAAAPLAAAPCLAALARGEVDVVTFASPSAVDGLGGALGAPGLAQLLTHAAVAAIGPTTAAALARRGRSADAVAEPGTLDGLVAAALAAHLRFTERKLPCRS